MLSILSNYAQDNMFTYSIAKYTNNGVSCELTEGYQKMALEQVYHPNHYCKLWTYFWESEEPSRTVWDFQVSYINTKDKILHAIDGNDSAFYSFAIKKDPLKYVGTYNYHGYTGGIYTAGFGNVITLYTNSKFSSQANLGINYYYPHNIGAIVRMIIHNGKHQIVFQLTEHGKSTAADKTLVWKPNPMSKLEMEELSVISWITAGFDI
jgi:hypothetical protein